MEIRFFSTRLLIFVFFILSGDLYGQHCQELVSQWVSNPHTLTPGSSSSRVSVEPGSSSQQPLFASFESQFKRMGRLKKVALYLELMGRRLSANNPLKSKMQQFDSGLLNTSDIEFSKSLTDGLRFSSEGDQAQVFSEWLQRARQLNVYERALLAHRILYSRNQALPNELGIWKDRGFNRVSNWLINLGLQSASALGNIIFGIFNVNPLNKITSDVFNAWLFRGKAIFPIQLGKSKAEIQAHNSYINLRRGRGAISAHALETLGLTQDFQNMQNQLRHQSRYGLGLRKNATAVTDFILYKTPALLAVLTLSFTLPVGKNLTSQDFVDSLRADQVSIQREWQSLREGLELGQLPQEAWDHLVETHGMSNPTLKEISENYSFIDSESESASFTPLNRYENLGSILVVENGELGLAPFEHAKLGVYYVMDLTTHTSSALQIGNDVYVPFEGEAGTRFIKQNASRFYGVHDGPLQESELSLSSSGQGGSLMGSLTGALEGFSPMTSRVLKLNLSPEQALDLKSSMEGQLYRTINTEPGVYNSNTLIADKLEEILEIAIPSGVDVFPALTYSYLRMLDTGFLNIVDESYRVFNTGVGPDSSNPGLSGELSPYNFFHTIRGESIAGIVEAKFANFIYIWSFVGPINQSLPALQNQIRRWGTSFEDAELIDMIKQNYAARTYEIVAQQTSLLLIESQIENFHSWLVQLNSSRADSEKPLTDEETLNLRFIRNWLEQVQNGQTLNYLENLIAESEGLLPLQIEKAVILNLESQLAEATRIRDQILLGLREVRAQLELVNFD